ncbi:hydrolase, NUDIX family [Streptococcus cristatus ATCC 51100]|uniref:Hydrolase, NUDIX family n=1 Tax=Streptococcus cristatus ATCC 51100 TaxID=889201 RepID=A0AAV3EH98_STRCR|nr:NUDIX hydrolase [Streptococcus cristatus]EFX53232.1 hydrolase, NUDIX family [Streptococcus cristatus ATCC 51100]EGU69164.1 hydrolase, NUDIX family [Streptococcus cristatus ATCC 51100]KJQ57121.1 MutT/NUDIX hydrolase family protein [Streptococcus cristatus]SQG32208.1 NTP pyrophosphohydrolases including oxidative damage repair enzymes [Streptococcus cristatus ATCC 51100]
MAVKLIAHTLIEKDGKYLLIKRSKIKRGLPNVYPSYWDIPGGSVEENELPREAALREAMEEVNQKIRIDKIIHEDSQFDTSKNTVFTRLVYEAKIIEQRDILLDPEEHTDFIWLSSLEDLEGELIVPYLLDIFADRST